MATIAKYRTDKSADTFISKIINAEKKYLKMSRLQNIPILNFGGNCQVDPYVSYFPFFCGFFMFLSLS